MDFELTEEQAELAGLAGRILGDRCTHERLSALEADAAKNGIGSVHDAATWQALADAGVFSALLPGDDGGDLGVLGLALAAEEVGRRTAYVPLVACLALGALPLARFGREDLAGEVAAGRLIATAALEEPGEPDSVVTSARADGDGDGYVLDGAKTMVPYGDLADVLLVPAAFGDGRVAVAVVRRGAPGLETTPLYVTGKQPYADVELRGVRVTEVLGTPEQGAEITAWIRAVGTLAYAAEASGVCAEAVRMTAKYTSERKQFGEPIASFQAVGQRAANAYIDAEVLRLTMLQAAWLLDDAGRGGDVATAAEVEAAVSIAKFHAGDAGSRVLHACQHLHGGIGVDTDYPLHRYFVRGKQIEQTLGTATRQLLRIGAHLAESTS